MSSRLKYLVVSSSSALTVLLLIGSVMSKGASSTDDHYKYVGVFSEVVAKIKGDYVEEPDMKSVTLGALNGMLEAIDPFASYLNAEQYKEYLKNKDVKRADIGLILSKKSGYVGVVGVVPNSPAAKAGFATLDMIESIKGISTRDMPLAYASMLMQGDPGTSIELSVWRTRRPEPQTVKLTRAMLTLPPVDSKIMADQVGYIDINALSADHVKEVAAAVQSLEKQGARKLMVDVRDCATGTPEDGIALANLFVKQGRITYLVGQRVARQNFDADPSKAITSLPMVVLTNRGTAGAAEILATAVKDNKRGDVVGERTYGDAAMLKAINMDDGGAIILSVAKYYGADGKAIQDTGVLPGTLVQEADTQVDYDDNGEPIVDTTDQQPPKQKKLEDDPVVKKGLEILSKAA
jgi:carboxyl-terminal processing protease